MKKYLAPIGWMLFAGVMLAFAITVGQDHLTHKTPPSHYVPFPTSTPLPPSSLLPNRSWTPGAVRPHTTLKEICTVGWTATVRPPESYTEALKIQQLNSGYAYQGDRTLSHYEEDHLIPLELGGSPRSIRNLWPEPYPSAHLKDRTENALHALVCSRQVSMASAQRAIAREWRTALQVVTRRP